VNEWLFPFWKMPLIYYKSIKKLFIIVFYKKGEKKYKMKTLKLHPAFIYSLFQNFNSSEFRKEATIVELAQAMKIIKVFSENEKANRFLIPATVMDYLRSKLDKNISKQFFKEVDEIQNAETKNLEKTKREIANKISKLGDNEEQKKEKTKLSLELAEIQNEFFKSLEEKLVEKVESQEESRQLFEEFKAILLEMSKEGLENIAVDGFTKQEVLFLKEVITNATGIDNEETKLLYAMTLNELENVLSQAENEEK